MISIESESESINVLASGSHRDADSDRNSPRKSESMIIAGHVILFIGNQVELHWQSRCSNEFPCPGHERYSLAAVSD
jgi:hypothetical protein